MKNRVGKIITAGFAMTALVSQTVFAATTPVNITQDGFVLNEDINVSAPNGEYYRLIEVNGNNINATINGDASIDYKGTTSIYGVMLDGSQGGYTNDHLTVNGDVTVNTEATISGYYNYGVEIYKAEDSTITINGDVSITESGDYGLVGIYAAGKNSFIKTGDVTAKVEKEDKYGKVYGLYSRDGAGAEVGKIIVEGNNYTYGVYSDSGSGSVKTGNVEAQSTYYAYGVYAATGSTMVKTGDIKISGYNGNAVCVCEGTVETGNVTVNVVGEKDYSAYGLWSGAYGDSFTKTKNISVSSDEESQGSIGVAGWNYGAGTKNDILVEGDVEARGGNSEGVSVYTRDASSSATILVNGDVTSDAYGIGIYKCNGEGTVVVDGIVEGNTAAIGAVDEYGDVNIIVYELKTGEDGKYADVGEEAAEEKEEALLKNVNYIVRNKNASAIKVSGTTKQEVTVGTETYSYDTATEGTEITIRLASDYELSAGTLKVTRESNGSYTVIVPRGGGVTLSAILKAVEEQKASFTGTADQPITNGTWNCGPGEQWTFRTDGIFKNTWGHIALADGKTGWFYFDKDGIMVTGWKQIDGKWYYFNEAHDGTYGMMLSNTTTADGYRLGTDGAWIQ